LADRLAQLVRRCAVPGAPPHGPLVWGVDGWVPYVTAIGRVFRDPVRSGQGGHPRQRRWPELALAQVIKHTTEPRR
jgi:hypothetical protein